MIGQRKNYTHFVHNVHNVHKEISEGQGRRDGEARKSITICRGRQCRYRRGNTTAWGYQGEYNRRWHRIHLVHLS